LSGWGTALTSSVALLEDRPLHPADPRAAKVDSNRHALAFMGTLRSAIVRTPGLGRVLRVQDLHRQPRQRGNA